MISFYSVLLTISLVLTGICLLHTIKKCKRPKNYRPFIYTPFQRPKGDNKTQRFSPDKIPQKGIDHIIIGGGISGLTCAAALAKNGKRCLVLEKHDTIGGSIHVFKEQNLEFDTGFHYTGSIEKTKELLNFLGEFKVEWNKIGEGDTTRSDDRIIFDSFAIGDCVYNSVAGAENFIKEIINSFPEEEKNIRRYITDIKRLSNKLEFFFKIKAIRNNLLKFILRKTILRKHFALAKTCTYDFVSEYTKNKELIEVLCALSIDAGPPPKKQSAFLHVGIVDHFLEGGYYPKGGPQKIIESLIRTIEISGGRVLTQVTIKRITTELDKVTGVLLEYGRGGRTPKEIHVSCNSIISSVGIPNTYKTLLGGTSSTYFDRFMNLVPSSVTYFFLYVSLNGTKEELGLKERNLWIWPDKPFDEVIEKFEKEPFKEPPVMFIASNSAKDNGVWNKKFPGKSAVVVISWCTTDLFSDIDEGTSGHRSNSKYKSSKRYFEDLLLKCLYRFYPQTKGKIISYTSSTPSTVKYYLNSINGECYGMDANLYRFGDFPEVKPETNIKGLWLTGQDITSLGFSGAMWSGVLTANCIEGYGSLLDIVVDRDLIGDLKKCR